MTRSDLQHASMLNGLSIRRRRSALGWTQMELAARSGVTQSWVSKLEAGREINLPRMHQMDAVLTAAERERGMAATPPDLPPPQSIEQEPNGPPSKLVSAMNNRFDGGRHDFRDAAAIASLFVGVSTPDLADEQWLGAAEKLLDAAAVLRARGVPITTHALLLHISAL